MIAVKIKGANKAYGAPAEWNPAKDGDCGVLQVRVENRGRHPVMLSCWKPSSAELEALQRGGSVVLGVVGDEHPPVLLMVSEED